MEDPNSNSQPDNKDSFNYFNYFTEIEEEFVRRRGKPMFISPMDWALIESWKNAQIPLHIVIRAINESFDAYETKGRKYRKVNSIFYCEQTVESLFADYRLSQVGASTTEITEIEKPNSKPQNLSAFSPELILESLAQWEKGLTNSEIIAATSTKIATLDAIRRGRGRLIELIGETQKTKNINEEALEHDLDAIDRLILKSIIEDLSPENLQDIKSEANSQLGIYKKKMDKKIYQRTVDNFISRRLREINQIPRLSLFYI